MVRRARSSIGEHANRSPPRLARRERDTALTIAENLLEDETGTADDVAVVGQSEGVRPLLSDGDHEDRIRSLVDQGVEVSACENTLASMDVDRSDLVEGVEPVPEGAVEVTKLESDGYAYLRP